MQGAQYWENMAREEERRQKEEASAKGKGKDLYLDTVSSSKSSESVLIRSSCRDWARVKEDLDDD